ncbi:hypothetical protein ACN47E_006475 [Coniothyrium glycines]
MQGTSALPPFPALRRPSVERSCLPCLPRGDAAPRRTLSAPPAPAVSANTANAPTSASPSPRSLSRSPFPPSPDNQTPPLSGSPATPTPTARLAALRPKSHLYSILSNSLRLAVSMFDTVPQALGHHMGYEVASISSESSCPQSLQSHRHW